MVTKEVGIEAVLEDIGYSCLVKDATVIEKHGDKYKIKVELHRLTKIIRAIWLVKNAEVVTLEDCKEVVCWIDVELDRQKIDEVTDIGERKEHLRKVNEK